MNTPQVHAFRRCSGSQALCSLALSAGAAALGLYPQPILANPGGLTVLKGQATAIPSGPFLQVTAGNNAVLDWRTFNIGRGETTSFIQPSASAIVWNRINDANVSQILGNLQANGRIVVYNSSGFYIGPDAKIDAASLTLTTQPVSLPGGPEGLWQYNGTPPAAPIENHGMIRSATGGSIFLIADRIENTGDLVAPGGVVGLHAGRDVQLSERPDGRGLSVQVRLPTGSVDNNGRVIADAGQILMNARVINEEGLVQAQSIREHNGIIELVAADTIALGGHASLSAAGDTDPGAPSNAGTIRLVSQSWFQDAPGASIDVRGGAGGGNGGSLEISAASIPALHTGFLASAQPGWVGAKLSLDPNDIRLGAEGSDSAPNGIVEASQPSDSLFLNPDLAFAGFSSIHLEARHDIILTEGTLWNLEASTGISGPGSLLSLEAGHDIRFENNARIAAGSGWSVQLAAGRDFTKPATVVPGAGGIFLDAGSADVPAGGNGSIETGAGNIHLLTGNGLRIGSGFIRTTAGGSIQVESLGGIVDAGSRADTFQFTRAGAVPSNLGVGGIATVHGGDVTIASTGDIQSFLPFIGAYGPGNVTLKSGSKVLGRFLLSEGRGSIEAGGDVGDEGAPTTLALISGGWSVKAANDIFLNEAFNPNGTLNPNRLGSGARIKFQFNYAADASLDLRAGHGISLLGSNLARTSENRDMLPVYPPILQLDAGSGGIMLGNELVLYPSVLGQLNLSTRDGGSLRSTPDHYFQLVLSDSGDPAYTTFATGHAIVPLHRADPDPARIHISGNVENVFVRVPKRARIEIGGNTLNFGFEGQNLAETDVTSISIAGDLANRGNQTSVTLAGPVDESVLDPLFTGNPELVARLRYDASTGRLTFIGRMSTADRDFLLQPLVKQLDLYQQVILDDRGNPVLAPATFTQDALSIRNLYNATLDIPETGLAFSGLQIGGPGQLSLSARNLDLGITRGLRSVGPLLNPALARISPVGADLSISLDGNLEMIASQIASFSGGSIRMQALGSLNIGSQESFTSDDTPKGIFSTSGGGVQVVAQGDVNVNGSRIASYNGGNVEVRSVNGDVNAGQGGLGSVSIFRTVVDPVSGEVGVTSTTIPGSGILATALADSLSPVGNITVSAGRDILASRGGVIQLAFNPIGTKRSAVTLDAGRNIDAQNSGVIGGNVRLDARGSISGLVIASENIDISARQNVNVTAVAQGGVNINASGSVSGSVIGGSGVAVSGSSITAALVSQSVSASGDLSSASIGTPQVAAAKSESRLADPTEKAVANPTKPTDQTPTDDSDVRKRRPLLTRRTGRVTVILPKSTP